MDRANRSLLIASTFLAVPAALLMASLSHGKSPEVQLAVGQGGQQSHPIQQVAGQQTRPGLLQVLAGTSSKGNENHQHQNMSKTPSKGLLDTLFSRSNANRSQPSAHGSGSQQGSANPHARPTPTAQPDWSGIPYHEADATGKVTQSVPLRDPGDPSLAAGVPTTRIIRGGSSRTVQALPASARRSEPMVARSPSSVMALPTPPREETPTPATTEDLSSNSSSRRVNRRSVETLSAPDSVGGTGRQSNVSQGEVADLVPRVSRTPIQSAVAKKGSENKTPEKTQPVPESRIPESAPSASAKAQPPSTPNPQRPTPERQASGEDERCREFAKTDSGQRERASLLRGPSETPFESCGQGDQPITFRIGTTRLHHPAGTGRGTGSRDPVASLRRFDATKRSFVGNSRDDRFPSFRTAKPSFWTGSNCRLANRK